MKNKYDKILIDLEAKGEVDYDISHRGGHYGVSASALGDILALTKGIILGDKEFMLPRKVGAFVNYLGGGLRGAVCTSDYNASMPKTIAAEIDKFTTACKKRYIALENDMGLNNDTYPDGDTNWDAIGTARSRDAGITSGY